MFVAMRRIISGMMWFAVWMWMLVNYVSMSMLMHMDNYFPRGIAATAVLSTDPADAPAFRAFICFQAHD